MAPVRVLANPAHGVMFHVGPRAHPCTWGHTHPLFWEHHPTRVGAWAHHHPNRPRAGDSRYRDTAARARWPGTWFRTPLTAQDNTPAHTGTRKRSPGPAHCCTGLVLGTHPRPRETHPHGRMGTPPQGDLPVPARLRPMRAGRDAPAADRVLPGHASGSPLGAPAGYRRDPPAPGNTTAPHGARRAVGDPTFAGTSAATAQFRRAVRGRTGTCPCLPGNTAAQSVGVRALLRRP